MHDTSNDQEEIYTADEKNLKFKSGIFRLRDKYGTVLFAKSGASGEENKLWFLVKYADGDIHYQEKELVIGGYNGYRWFYDYDFLFGQNDGWRRVTDYKFDPTSLEWKKIK